MRTLFTAYIMDHFRIKDHAKKIITPFVYYDISIVLAWYVLAERIKSPLDTVERLGELF